MLSTDEFERKIKMGIPMNKVPHPPNLEEFYGKSFSCGCGKNHVFDRSDTPVFVDLGMFKVCVVVKECSHLNSLKLKSFFNNEIKTLDSCIFEKEKERFGFKLEHPKFDEVIEEYI